MSTSPAIPVPPPARRVAEVLAKAGGRVFLVGGAVRDALLGLPLKDIDLEVFGLEAAAIPEALAPHARIEPVGDSFPVFKVAGLEGVEGEIDVALPRRDSKKGKGHRGIAAVADPFMSAAEAARRRDFTINALMLDVSSGELLDSCGGLEDLRAGVLRMVDAATFAEDPLRALRAAQFAARFGMTVEPATAAVCASMSLDELPAERIAGEIEKALLRAPRPSVAFKLLAEWNQLRSVAPELLPLAGTPQDPEWHPEGDVWIHTLLALDQARGFIDDLDLPRALAVMLGVLCHDLGKPPTTKFEDGRIRSRGHEEAGVPPTLSLLDRWNIHTRDGYALRDQVVALVRDHLKPGMLYPVRGEVSVGAIRRLARRVEPDLLYRVAKADCLGRTGNFSTEAMEWFIAEVRRLSVEREAPAALLQGRDLLALGMKPGPEVGRVLAEVYEQQMDSRVTTRAEAIELARALLARAP